MDASPREIGPDNATFVTGRSYDTHEFDESLFRALHAMAIKSPRFQADVHAAMRHANISASAIGIATALQRLEVAGRLSNLIPLSDGGLLVTVAV